MQSGEGVKERKQDTLGHCQVAMDPVSLSLHSNPLNGEVERL